MAPPPPTSTGGSDPMTQMNTYRSYVTMLADPGAKDEIKLKAAQELSENFEIIMGSSQYPAFLDHSMKIFLKILQDGEPHFIAEYNIQQVRKLILEMIHRLPTNEHLRPFVKQILSLMLHLLETENEENVLVCLHIIIELHKQYRPTFNTDILHFLQFVKCIYRELPNHLNKIFEPRPPIRVKDLSEVNIEALLSETFTLTAIQSEKKTPDGTVISYNLIPKAVLSLKVLQELPIIVVLMYQLYKQNVHKDVAEFIPLIMTTITLQPATHHRVNPAFNREVFVDFMGAQIKTLSFLAYIIRIYQEVVSQHASLMVKGMLGLLTLCPMEVAHLRKELLIAARHILATDLRIKFVPFMERLFDERVLLGRGWTTHESLRPLAYSTLADLVHHVRQHLPLSDLARAVHLFSKNVHDESLPTSIQTMSCKLLLNLVDCIRQKSEAEAGGQGRELLMRMLEVFVLKFKTIAKLQLPVLMNKFSAPAQLPTAPNAAAVTEDVKPVIVDGVAVPPASSTVHALTSLMKEEKDKSRFGFPASQSANYSVTDCRSLVKTLVCGVKTITWGCASCKVVSADGSTTGQSKHFQPKETLVFVRLVRWALLALDVFTITPPNPVIGPLGNLTGAYTPQATQPPRPSSIQQVRSKEEKEVLEHFGGVFAMMNHQTFQEIFSTTMEYMVERIHQNSALQTIGNSFLANPTTSPVFATVLIRYLLERMEEMGHGAADRSNLYLKLFKLVFGSVSLFPTENEKMLRPHLHQIVNRSMELAMTAKEPYNYFLLLRALFRSIGGGGHDLLYQEFLPLLPNLLQGLNSLQSGLHKQHMKALFVELCLTVPVRLSSLLPYLPMLMDPLVSALNGSHTLISQGLRTLELCVDNLQHDFLYEHIQPVRADLMQALWRTLRNPTDQVAHVAFRVLGKFGGGNRKMMIEPQKLDYNEKETNGPAIVAHFLEHKTPIAFPVEKVIETAFDALKSSTTDPFYHRQCWEVIRCYLVASIDMEDDRHMMLKLLTHPSFTDGKIPPIQGPVYKCTDKLSRNTHQTALTGMFVAAAIKEVSSFVLPTLVSLVRHYTLVAISQQGGPFPVSSRQSKLTGMDPLVLVDSLAVIMGHEEKELSKPGQVALMLILETARSVLGSRERACRLPMMEYLADSMCSLCYDRAWYAKLGGCIAIKLLFEQMSTQWIFEHLYLFLKALLFVMMDLTGEVSSGAIDMAKANLERMLTACAAPLPENSSSELEEAQRKSLFDVTHELVRQVTSPNTLVREQAMHSLEVIAKIQNRSVTDVMEPHKDVLADMIPPKKHLLRHQPANAQIGLMDGNTFCTTLQPRLFTIDLSIEEHKIFFLELKSLCEVEDAALLKLPCYKSLAATGGGTGSAVVGGVPGGGGGASGVSGILGSGGGSDNNPLIPLRRSALRALAACHYVVEWREKIFSVLYRALERPHPELREAAFDCMKRFIAGFQIDMERVHGVMRPLLLTLADYRYFNLSGAKHLSYLTQLFPTTFNEKLCDNLLQHLKKLQEMAITAYRSGTRSGDNEERIATIIGIFHQIPAASSRYLEMLCRIVLQAERSLLVEAGSPFRAPLLKFLLRYPSETIDVFFQENNIKDQQWSRFFEFLIKHKDGKPFRDVLQNSSVRLINMAMGLQYQTSQLGNTSIQPPQSVNLPDKPEIQYQSIRITSLLIKFDDQWLITQHQLVTSLKTIWCSEEYQEKHKRVDAVDFQHWKEPKLLVKILLQYFCHHPTEIDLLFQLLRALCDRFIPDFQFLRDFLENTVAASYTVEWKRAAFFRFVEAFQHDHSVPSTENTTNGNSGAAAPASPHNSSLYSQELKARVLQYILIPCFAVSFERGEGERLVGGPPAPDQDNTENVVSVFISRVIDPENPFGTADSVRILLLQFSCLLVEQASPHIHDAANKRQGSKLRRLMTFAWPCLLGKNCVDPATRYHGHLLLSHIIAKFAIHKRIVLQVFHGLLKAHAVEARNVVRQALEILTPSVPVRMEDGNTMLTHWTKKIIVEEGHTIGQLFHILQLVVRHYKVYYPVRHHLVQHMVASIQRLGFSPSGSLEHRKLAVELAEVIVKWELQRIKDETMTTTATTVTASASPCEASPTSISSYHHDHALGSPAMVTTGMKRPSIEDPGDGPPRKRHTSGQTLGGPGGGSGSNSQMVGASTSLSQVVAQQKVDGSARPIERAHADAVLNFLFRLACMVNDANATVGSPGELLSRRCVALLKAALKPEVWPAPQCDIKLAWLDKLFAAVESATGSGGSGGVGGMAGMSGGFASLGGSQPNYANICTALDLLTFLVSVLRKEQILVTFRPLQRGISACMTCPNLKVIKLVHGLLTRLMSIFPTEATNSPVASRFEELECLYACVNKVVLEGLSSYEKSPSGGSISGSASSSAANTSGSAVTAMSVGAGQGGVSSLAGGGSANAPSSLFGTLMVLKAACAHNPCYIDRLITSFMRVLQRMTREHLSPGGADSSLANELLVLSLDLVKNRVGVMGVEMRKAFIGNILVGLIEKTPDVKVMKTIIKMLEEWMKNKNPIAVNQGPSLREKSILLVKLMQYVEKRFPDDLELNAQFLEIVNFVYRDDTLKATELTSKLEPAFLAGLRCVQPSIRAKFFEVFDNSMRRRLYDRLLYIVCSQNWESMGAHFWIKQCIELVLVTCVPNIPIQISCANNTLPGICSVIKFADSTEKANFVVYTTLKEEPPEAPNEAADAPEKEDENVLDLELSSVVDGAQGTTSSGPGMVSTSRKSSNGTVDMPGGTTNAACLQQLVARQSKFIESAKEVRSLQLLLAAAQLCHMDSHLAEQVWIALLPRVWKILSEKQQMGLTSEIVPFLCSGAHVVQKDCHPSALNVFVEALAQCSPPIPIKPCLMKYLGKSHNLWHRMVLSLEQLGFDPNSDGSLNSSKNKKETGPGSVSLSLAPVSSLDCYGFEPSNPSPMQETYDSLSDLYTLLCEEDMWAGLWQRSWGGSNVPPRYRETAVALAYEQQGFFERAQTAYEAVMAKARQTQEQINNHSVMGLQSEYSLWEKHWMRCSKELNQWELLMDYGNMKGCNNPFLVLESSWRLPNWVAMKEALSLVELSCPKEMAWKVNLYRGFLAICNQEDQHLSMVERHVEAASGLCMREWRRLPRIVSHAHLPLLQAAQQIMELQEALQIHQGLLHGRNSSLHDMKAIVKTWRNRLPVIADDLSHWSDIFTWRQHHYQFIASHYDTHQTDTTSNHSMLGVHASAQAIIHFGKVARKHNLTGVCLDSLSRIYTIPSVPIVDCFQKIRQQVKCYLQMAQVTGKNELQEGLEVIESTNLKYFTKEMTAEFYALKGMLLAQIGRSEEANKAFSGAVQMHDTLVKAWALWGDYLEGIFTRDARQLNLGVSAITCFLHACRHQNESKSRKYLAKVLWLLTYDDEKCVLTEAVDKWSVGVPPAAWLPWVPQLLTCLVRAEGRLVLNLLSSVGRVFPQAVYFPIRTLYLTLKIEQRERYKSAELAAAKQAAAAAAAAAATSATGPASTPTKPNATSETGQQTGEGTDNATMAQSPSVGASNNPSSGVPIQTQPTQSQPRIVGGETGPIRATPPMWRCSRIMHMQRDIHPTVLSSLEGIVDQMVWFRENWYEEVLRQLRQGLAKCHAIAFENRGAVTEATITPHTLNFVKKLVSTFGIGIENINSSGSVSTTFGSAASESLARRAQATVQDPVFQRMKGQFSSDFDFTLPSAVKLHNLIHKLKKWIKILEAKTKLLPKSFLVEEKCRFLSNFSLQTAEVELPGEFLLPKHSHYYVRISRFMPRVEIVQKHNTAARRLYIRGHNGKIYPYLVVNDSGLGDARREERVLQLLRMLNHYLGKQKETSRRFLHITVPRVVAVSPQMRLVEDSPSSVSLLDIYKKRCARRPMEYDAPVAHYYERLAVVQSRGSQASHQVLRDILRGVQNNMVPRSLLREWAVNTFQSATDYWTFRKTFTLQLALVAFVEYVLHLTRLNPDMMYIHQDSGLINVSYFKFDVDDGTGELDANRPVPFRLTPNIFDFVTTVGVGGPLTASMIASARCLVTPGFKVQTILRAVLRDEMIAWHKKKQDDTTETPTAAPPDMEGDLLVNMVTRAVNAVMNRLQSLATFEGTDSKVSTLVAAANSHDNLCRMDPAWHPWL
ncbi:transformation/transcription domain-associated protein [Hetaerina americana]|uniref:transformation/transcription domain-associated protein n=1 Tax=Hetaerina americana TaxID=62018 RepID=UPI003A7F595E